MPKVIPFYGAHDPAMFAIERRCMDRDGAVVRRLDDLLPDGIVLDVGAGDGFTAERLTQPGRTVVAMEPAAGMIRRERRLPWIRGAAQDVPLADDSIDGAYATWAFFFSGMPGVDVGLAELDRVVRPGGPIVIVDNAGDDEFLSFAADPHGVTSDQDWWRERSFSVEIVRSVFRFDTLDQARRLFEFFFGEAGRAVDRTEFTYNVAMYRRSARQDAIR